MPMRYGLLQPADLPISTLPGALDGVRIAHITDLHASRHRRRHDQIIAQLQAVRVDLVFYTGDYMDHTGDEKIACEVLSKIANALRPRWGSFGVFGNHDNTRFRDMVLSQDLPIHWLENRGVMLDQAPIEILGLSALKHQRIDAVRLAIDSPPVGIEQENAASTGKRLRLMLCHFPSGIKTAADMGAHAVFVGHTHGGQICPLPGRPLYNSTDLPLSCTSGVLRTGNTLAAISRGLGETLMPVRLFCPPHLPVYTLRKAGLPGQATDVPVNVRPW